MTGGLVIQDMRGMDVHAMRESPPCRERLHHRMES
jgi:hypothetical protein